VDPVEAAEVERQHRERLPWAPGSREGVVQTVAEERAVWKGGQAVMERLPGELLFQLQSLGDVTSVEDDAADLPLGAQVADMRLELPRGAGGVRDAKDELARFARGRSCAHYVPIVLVD